MSYTVQILRADLGYKFSTSKAAPREAWSGLARCADRTQRETRFQLLASGRLGLKISP